MLVNKCLVCGFLELLKPILLYLPMQEKMVSRLLVSPIIRKYKVMDIKCRHKFRIVIYLLIILKFSSLGRLWSSLDWLKQLLYQDRQCLIRQSISEKYIPVSSICWWSLSALRQHIWELSFWSASIWSLILKS